MRLARTGDPRESVRRPKRSTKMTSTILSASRRG
jgi:hypothetical protein